MKHESFRNKVTSRTYSVSSSLIIIYSLLFPFSCKKEPAPDNPFQLKYIDGYRLNVDPLEIIGKNENDLEDEYINEKLLIVSGAVKEAAKSIEFNNTIKELLKEDHFITINELQQRLPEFNSILTFYINLKANTMNKTSDGIDDYINDLLHNGTYYDAILYVFNYENANFSMYPIVSPGIEVEDNEALGIDDCIFSYYLDESENEYEIILSENEAINAENPVYIVSIENFDDGSDDKRNNSMTFPEDYSNSVNEMARTTVYTGLFATKVKANYEFESSGKSEYYIAGCGIDASALTSMTSWLTEEYNHPVDYYPDEYIRYQTAKRFKKIETFSTWLNIGDVKFYAYLPIAGDNYEAPQPIESIIIFNAYEHDWYILNDYVKFLGGQSLEGVYVEIVARMKFDDEWYLKDPADGPIVLRNSDVPAVGSTIVYEGTNGGLELKVEDW